MTFTQLAPLSPCPQVSAEEKQAAVLHAEPGPEPFEVSGHVLLFMQSEAAGTTSAALCDPHSADLKEADRCQVYQRAKVQPGGAARTCNASREAAPPLRS